MKQRREIVVKVREQRKQPEHTDNGEEASINPDNLFARRFAPRAPQNGKTGVSFSNQPPVTAALSGGILVLDGIDLAERNVLPLLNNLLENREINLESGELVVSAERYKELRDGYAERSNIIPAHEDFRVIGLGLPVGPWKGEKLDPPLRSRFQCLRVDPPR